MKNDFVPFLPNGPGGNVASRADAAQAGKTLKPFQPMTTASPAPTACTEPTVTLHRSEGRVARITIQCPCGNVIELACDYSDTPPA
jgi:hypothetical protein